MIESSIYDICAELERQYSSPDHGNKIDPLDELVYIILSTRTQDRSFRKTYDELKRVFREWDDVTAGDSDRLVGILAPAGLDTLKTTQIFAILAHLRSTFGRATLEPLGGMTDQEAETFLTSLPGIGPKIAKCVLMYSLGRRVLPVDVHVHRVATRLGLRTKRRPDTSQGLIEDAVPPDLRYGFHVNAIAHGRTVCTPKQPRCAECCIARWCNSGRARTSPR